jgi:hypothetical protein
MQIEDRKTKVRRARNLVEKLRALYADCIYSDSYFTRDRVREITEARKTIEGYFNGLRTHTLEKNVGDVRNISSYLKSSIETITRKMEEVAGMRTLNFELMEKHFWQFTKLPGAYVYCMAYKENYNALQWTGGPYYLDYGEGHVKCGPLIVRLRYDKMVCVNPTNEYGARLVQIEKAEPWAYDFNGKMHPHHQYNVGERDGDYICLGAPQEVRIREAMASGEIMSAVQIIESVLNAYNEAETENYHVIFKFANRPRKNKQNTCSSCGDKVKQNQIVIGCERCGGLLCDECNGTCPNCSKLTCEDCQCPRWECRCGCHYWNCKNEEVPPSEYGFNCEECGDFTCRDCIDYCDGCDKYFCGSDCCCDYTDCHKCGRTLYECQDDKQFTCVDCGEIFCTRSCQFDDGLCKSCYYERENDD